MTTTTTSELCPRRLPAEWERHGAILMAWPHADTDWVYMLDEVQTCYLNILKTITRDEPVILLVPEDTPLPSFPKGVITVEVPTNDTWTRDYGPLTALSAEGEPIILDFRFNGWGLKFAANHDNQATRRLIHKSVFRGRYECCKDLVLEGGSIESDGRGTILTTRCCLMAPNRNEPMTPAAIEAEILCRFGARKLLWLDYGSLAGDDTDGHIDTLCRLAPHNTILYTGCQDAADEHHDGLTRMARQLRHMTNADGERFNLIELPLPDPIFDDAIGERLPATYANYLVLNHSVVMPTYGQPKKDRLAADTLRVAFPDREILTVDCRALVRQHGSLHCATMQLPTEIVSFL